MSNNLLIFILITILFLDLYDQLTYDKNINIKPVMYSMNNELNNNNIKFKSNYTDKFNNIDYDQKSKDNDTETETEPEPYIGYESVPDHYEEPVYINKSLDNSINKTDKTNKTNKTNKTDNSINNTDNSINKTTDNSINKTTDNSINKTIDNSINKTIDNENITKFGKPYNYKKNEYIIWQFDNPAPWTKIVYKYGHSDPYNFYIKVKISSLNDYENWKNIITNLYFNPTTAELVIPTKDEETALALANLMVSNFNGDLSLQEIINRDLIAISISKAFKYVIVRNKIREQIISSINYKNTKDNNSNNLNNLNTKNNSVATKNSQENDTSNYFYYGNKNNKNKTDTEFEAYEGSEFSFI
jgi:hypothetical protein